MVSESLSASVVSRLGERRVSIDLFLQAIFYANPVDYAKVAALYLPMHEVNDLLSLHRQKETTTETIPSVCSVCGTGLDTIHVCARCNTSEAQAPVRGRRKATEVLTQRRNHFKMAMNCFQGKTNRHIPDDIIGYIRKRVTQIPVSITRSHIAAILRSQKTPKYSKFYKDVSYIHHIVTQEPLPDLSSLETRLLLMFDIGFFFAVAKQPCKGSVALQNIFDPQTVIRLYVITTRAGERVHDI